MNAREPRFSVSQREDQLINEKLAMIKTPTTHLLPIRNVEKRFSGRARLYIGNLPSNIKEEDLKCLFRKYGEIEEIFINQIKGFGFIQMDYRYNAERAKNELIRYNIKGRPLVIKNAHPAAIRVKNIPPFVSNELLHMAFTVFGEIEHAYIIVDDRGNPIGEGVVEFFRKPAANLAIKRCSVGCFFLTSSLKPVIVENYEPHLDTTGYPEQMIQKSSAYYRERNIGPRFANPGSLQFHYAERWKALYQQYKEKVATLKTDLYFELQKLDAEMMSAQCNYETERLIDMLRIREMDRKRLQQDWEIRRRQLEEQHLRERQRFSEEPARQEQQSQEQSRIDSSKRSASTSQFRSNLSPGHHNYRPMNKRPRH